MVFLCESTALEVTICLICLSFMIYLKLTSKHTYWSDKHIAYVEPRFPFGTEKEIVLSKLHISEYVQKIYTSFRKDKVVGLYEVNNPYLLIRDVELAKRMLTTDFQHFVGRGILDSDLIAAMHMNLFIMEGKMWKYVRSKLTPAFTSGKLKLMFHLMEACANELISLLTLSTKQDGNVDVNDIVARYTTDIIASCGFGIDSNSIRDPDCEFRMNGKMLCKPITLKQMLKYKFAVTFPWLCKQIGLRFSESSLLHNFFVNIVAQTISYRKTNGIIRNNFIDHLMRLRDDTNVGKGVEEILKIYGSKDEGEVSFDEIVAQATVFFTAGLSNTVQAITLCLYEITRNPDVQSNLLNEVNEVLRKHSGVMSYQAVQSMSYLEAVINETLRRYPTANVLIRKCNEDYKIPGMSLVIEKGTMVTIPIYAYHHDPDYYPDPYKFSPERFLDKSANHAAYLPFGEGPRYCIAVTFSMVTMKLCIAEIVRNFKLSMSERTPQHLVFSAKHFNTTTDAPIILKFSARADE